MSLEYAAEAVRSKGRGDDTMLVHMTPGEVKGLQQLAMAYGGSLSTNPETGLPEAGFLKSLLPTLIGAGLTIFSGGAINPLTAGLIVGGVEGVRTGDLGKGLMAGLGAYGGAGLTTAAAAAAPAANVTAGGAATGLTAGQAGAVTPTLSNVGAGVGNMFSSGATGEAARQSAMTSLGGGAGAFRTGVAATAGPLSQPIPMPEVEKVEYNYDGPYKPTERQVRYPGPERDPTDSSEFLYFTPTNPYPGFETAPENLYQLAEGGPTVATPLESYVPGQTAEFDYGFRQLAAQIPQIQQEAAVYNPVVKERYGYTPSDGSQPPSTGSVGMGYIPGYVAGQDAEFVYGFQPMAAQVPEIQAEAARQNEMVQAPDMSDGDGGDYMGPGTPINRVNSPLPREARMSIADRISAMNMAQQQRAAAAAAAAIAAGNTGSSNDFSGNDGGGFMSTSEGHAMGAAANPDRKDGGYGLARGGEVDMHNNGFVVDAHTVSEVGNGSSNAGMERFARIGGQPIMGPGDGTSDSIPANIDGMQPAMVARDEVYMPPDAVAMYGGGSLKVGEKKLYALMEQARKSRKKNGRGQSTGLKQLVS